MQQHDFAASLKVEETNAHLAEEALRHFFPTGTITRTPSGPNAAQFNGEDYKILLPSGKALTVDAKADTYDTGNMVIEYWNIHDDGRTPTPGWAIKETTNDYILYQFVNTGTSYLLDKQRLLVLANQHQRTWCKRHRITKCRNKTFTTSNILLPLTEVDTLFGTASKWTHEK